MKHLRLVATVVLSTFIACSLVSTGFAQQAAASTPTPAVTVTLKLTVVISRFNGEKKVGSLPFVLMVVPGYDRDHSGDQTNLQMGADVPLTPTTTTDLTQKSVTSWSYRSVGTNMSASSRGANDTGQFSVNLTVTDSQLMNDTGEMGTNASGRPGRLQNFTSSSRLLLRDGQTVQYTVATDKTSGEVAKLDVTMNVIK